MADTLPPPVAAGFDLHDCAMGYAYTESTDPAGPDDWSTDDVVKAFKAGFELAMRTYAAQAVAEAVAQWQPIETAPKDGRFFLCWVSAVRYGETDDGQQYSEDVSQVDFCNWRMQSDSPDGGWFDPCCGQIGDGQAVTHWMPLPQPPRAGQGEP